MSSASPAETSPTTTKCWHPHDINSLLLSLSLALRNSNSHRSSSQPCPPDPRPNPQELLNERNKQDFNFLGKILDKIEKKDLETGLERERDIFHLLLLLEEVLSVGAPSTAYCFSSGRTWSGSEGTRGPSICIEDILRTTHLWREFTLLEV